MDHMVLLLRFTAWYGERDYSYVVFDITRRVLFSDSVGRKGGKQIRIIIHRNIMVVRFLEIVCEIGHAVGFLHKQSRPDCNSYVYVAIKLQSIQKGEENQFMRILK